MKKILDLKFLRTKLINPIYQSGLNRDPSKSNPLKPFSKLGSVWVCIFQARIWPGGAFGPVPIQPGPLSTLRYTQGCENRTGLARSTGNRACI
jgi:hypothetical protein